MPASTASIVSHSRAPCVSVWSHFPVLSISTVSYSPFSVLLLIVFISNSLLSFTAFIKRLNYFFASCLKDLNSMYRGSWSTIKSNNHLIAFKVKEEDVSELNDMMFKRGGVYIKKRCVVEIEGEIKREKYMYLIT